MRCRCLLALILPVAASWMALAQSDTVIRSTTRLVQVHVAAEDSQGRPVTDLRRADFRIFDEKKELPLAVFAVESGTALPAAGSPAADELQDSPAAGYSAILLDWLNGGQGDRLRGDDALRKVLKSFQPRQKVALFVLGAEPPNSPHPLRMLCDFADASVDLANLVEDPMALPGSEIPENPGRFDARTAAGRTSIEQLLFDWNNRILDTIRALSQIADGMAHLPAPKSLLWLSTGFPSVLGPGLIPGTNPAEATYTDEVEAVLDKLNRADVTVHAVDTLGLAVKGRSFPGTLADFAERTGGTAFYGRNDIDEGVRLALADMHSGYTLGFIVPEDASPGYHRIQVRITRPRVRLRYRESYHLGG